MLLCSVASFGPSWGFDRKGDKVHLRTFETEEGKRKHGSLRVNTKGERETRNHSN